MPDAISRDSLEQALIALAILTSLIAVLRGASIFLSSRRVLAEDAWLGVCFVCAITANVLYILLLRAFFRATDVGNGLAEPYPSIEDDGIFIQKTIFAITALYWGCLWAAKLSLLCIIKRLLRQLPYYIRMWWALVGLCAVTYVACFITLCLSCSSMEAWFTPNACFTRRDVIASNVSRYFSYSADVLTNVLIMALPIRLIFSLQMPLSRKISIGGMFCLGIICIVAATMRCTQIGEASGQPTMPWLALWGTIENTIAFVVCTGPGLYRATKMTLDSRKAYLQDNSGTPASGPYVRSRSNAPDGDDVRLKQYPRTAMVPIDHDLNSSEEGLVDIPGTSKPRDPITVEVERDAKLS